MLLEPGSRTAPAALSSAGISRNSVLNIALGGSGFPV
jgi:hypothetical protein